MSIPSVRILGKVREMARQYSVPVGFCAVDKKKILFADAEGKGYMSPKPAKDEVYDSDGKASHRYTSDALCKAHYLEAFAEVYPDADLPAI